MSVILIQINRSKAKDWRKNLTKKVHSFISGSNVSGSQDLKIKSTELKEERYKIGNVLETCSALSHADV